MSSQFFSAGSRITAALLNSIAPISVCKVADESVTSSAVLQNDNELFAAVAANSSYLFECYLGYEGGTAGSSDLQWEWSVPSGTLRYHAVYATAAVGLAIIGGAGYTGSSNPAAGTNGAGVLRGLQMRGSLLTSSAMTLQLKWAQNTSSGTATIVHAQSTLALWQVP